MVDEITEKQSQEITIDDIAAFVEAKARASCHPIFGNLSNEKKDDQKEPSRNRSCDWNSRNNFAIDN